MIIEKLHFFKRKQECLSFNITVETKAPVAALIIIGINAVILISAKTTSMANKTPAIGALKAAPIPAATPTS